MAKFKTVGEEIADEPEQIYDEAIEMSENLPPANDGNTDAQYEALQVAKTSDLKRPSKRRFKHLKMAVVVIVAVIIVAPIAVILFLVTREKTTTNGGWNVWSAWASCSETCVSSKTGLKIRQRQCNNPVPSEGGQYCEGNAYDTTHCNLQSVLEVNGTRAWQSSTWADCYAYYSIDGKLDEYFCPQNEPCKCLCAHTDSANSSWVMEFECPGTVKDVSLYFRSTHEHRNTDFKILVYDSFEAAKNDARGTACITYTGAGIVSKKTLLCDEPVYGKALRIQHFVNLKNDPYPHLQICETRVFLH